MNIGDIVNSSVTVNVTVLFPETPFGGVQILTGTIAVEIPEVPEVPVTEGDFRVTTDGDSRVTTDGDSRILA